MSDSTMLIRERDSLNAAQIPPASLNGTANTGGIDMSVFERAEFAVSWGANASPVTINAALYQGNAADGTSKVAVTNGLSSSYNTVNGALTMELRSDQMFARYLFCQLVTGGPLICGAMPRGTVARYAPANSYDNAQVSVRFAGYPGGPQY